MGDAHADIREHVRLYLMIFAALAVFTGLTVGASFIHFGSHSWNVVVGMVIALIKASMVAMVFMHLKWERRVIYAVLALCFVFFTFLMLLPGLTQGDTVHLPLGG
jgi:cytochrome c oxidase subunit 4